MADFKLNKPYTQSWNGISTNRDKDLTKPLPPRNIFVTHPYITGVFDIRWDNPLAQAENSNWTLLGVNIYRSIDSESGPYNRINVEPIQSLYFRDETKNILVLDEDVTLRLNKGNNPLKEWVIGVAHKPIVKEASQAVLSESPLDVTIRIDLNDGKGKITVPAAKINARTGEVFLNTRPYFNPITKKIEPALLPINSDSKCYCTYWYNTNLVKTNLYPRYFYKIATVGKDIKGNIIETDLNYIKASHIHEIEKVNYIWKSVIYKNRYLLEQLGERIKIFIRKEVGERCPNYSDSHQQAHNYCKLCFGTGIVGGYEGPIDALVAPPETERRIELTDVGLKLSYNYESWTGPSPLLRPRDFIVRQNGDRLTVGTVTPQGPNGATFQQHFTLNYRDTKDIIYQVPIHGGELAVPIADNTRSKIGVTDASPIIPAGKSNKSDEDKGRTIDYENITW